VTTPRAVVSRDGLPTWLHPMARVADEVDGEDLTRFLPPPGGGRNSAVLILFGGAGAPDGRSASASGDVLLIQRAATLSSHPGQPAFPGGAADPGDGDAVGTALRESVEETGLDASGVQPFAILPELYLPPSGFVVTPVLAWWRVPSPVRAVDTAEVSSVHRVRLTELVDPANRVTVTHPSGFVGPAFQVDGLLVWGFTAGLLSRLLELAGWDRPWDDTVRVPVPDPSRLS
jgi:8-oxo-dGTP pyrophosphatase MutT (NUDIX family)